MKKPRLIIETDDEISMQSQLHITINKQLNRIDLVHQRQNGHVEDIQLYPCDVDKLCEFLQKSKTWIESGYKEKLKPN